MFIMKLLSSCDDARGVDETWLTSDSFPCFPGSPDRELGEDGGRDGLPLHCPLRNSHRRLHFRQLRHHVDNYQ